MDQASEHSAVVDQVVAAHDRDRPGVRAHPALQTSRQTPHHGARRFTGDVTPHSRVVQVEASVDCPAVSLLGDGHRHDPDLR